MRIKDLIIGQEYAVGSQRDYEMAYCTRGIVIDVTSTRNGEVHLSFPRADGTSYDSYRVPGSIRGPWAEYEAHVQRLRETQERTRVQRENRQYVRDDRVARINAELKARSLPSVNARYDDTPCVPLDTLERLLGITTIPVLS